jgi:hypothetical protein
MEHYYICCPSRPGNIAEMVMDALPKRLRTNMAYEIAIETAMEMLGEDRECEDDYFVEPIVKIIKAWWARTAFTPGGPRLYA